MRTIRIEECEYALYEAIRDAIIETVPFALIQDMYSKYTKTAIFNFWDSDYIPTCLYKFIIQPPLSRENKEKMNTAIIFAFKAFS